MKLENQFVSLELAKKLKALGVKQESLFYWWRLLPTEPYILIHPQLDRRTLQGYVDAYPSAELYSAFTVAELGDMLPDEIEVHEQSYWLDISRPIRSVWQVGYQKNGSAFQTFIHEADTEADARARMLIYLVENKLITL